MELLFWGGFKRSLKFTLGFGLFGRKGLYLLMILGFFRFYC